MEDKNIIKKWCAVKGIRSIHLSKKVRYLLKHHGMTANRNVVGKAKLH